MNRMLPQGLLRAYGKIWLCVVSMALLSVGCVPSTSALQPAQAVLPSAGLGRPQTLFVPFVIRDKWLGFKQTYARGTLYLLGHQTVVVRSPENPRQEWPCAVLKDALLPTTAVRHLRGGWGHQAQALKGDWVNLLVLAPSRSQLVARFQAAGWTQPSLKAYLKSPWHEDNAFPISPLLLWSRAQDLAFSRDTCFNLSRRHHLRLWKSPWRCGASEVWMGTASRDISIEWSPFGWRGGMTTHRIDPDIDAERAFVLQTFAALHFKGGYLARRGLSPPVEGLNGNLDPYVSDGQLAILDLNQPHPQTSEGEWE
jgi:hypothetical protein